MQPKTDLSFGWGVWFTLLLIWAVGYILLEVLN
jgi:hypothetical protein